MRILSRSSRKCTVTGIDSHELQGLHVVQCAALVETNHGIVNFIMNECACYGKGHTIHSSGQIEWFKNSVDDRSVQVGGKQRICTIDGYSIHLMCRDGLMYLSLLGKPSDKDLERYPAMHLTGPHVTEKAERHTFKAPCCCFENAPYTELTIVCTINVSSDCN